MFKERSMQDASQNPPPFTPLPMPDVPFGIARPERVLGLSGHHAIRAVPTGKLPAPPMARTLPQWIEAADTGPCGISWQSVQGQSEHDGPCARWVDVGGAGQCAGQTVPEAGEAHVSPGTKAKFSRPITVKTRQVRAIGTVIDRIRRTASAQARVEDSAGRMLATGTTMCFLDHFAKG